jgi:hypothetical protein
MSLKGPDVRAKFSQVLNGVKGAVDYLRSHYQVHSLDNLPFLTTLVPLSVFFATDGNQEVKYDDDQRKIIDRWFWRSAFSRRYSSGVLRNLKTDIDEMYKLKMKQPTSLGSFSFNVSPEFFTKNKFGMNNVNTKTFILMLAQKKPLSFISGAPLDLAEKLKSANRTEFHHLMPKAFLESKGIKKSEENILANYCFLSRADNRDLGGTAPSVYKKKMPATPENILDHAICPPSLFKDDFPTFIKDRADLLTYSAKQLCA